MEKRPEMAKSFYDELVSGNRIIYVYTVDGEYLGEGSIVFERNDPDYSIPGQRIYFSRLVVKEEYRNQGIGSILVDHIIKKALELGYSEISVGVDKKNAGAFRLYQRKGFCEIIYDGEDEYGPYYKLLKRLGDNSMKDKILIYEELSLNALPALQTQFYDGWILRFTGGYSYTNRANSVNPLYPSSFAPTEKISECERRYFAQDQPTVFKITDGTDTELDKLLESGGYDVLTPTYLMTSDLTLRKFAIGKCVFSEEINDKWLEIYFKLSNYTETKKREIAKRVYENVKVSVLCGRIDICGNAVACGMCVIERGYAGLYNIVVNESDRGRGYGEEICVSLLAEAKRHGAHTSYLQVVQKNHAAVNLYKKLGYETAYSYWYRVKKEKA